MKKNNLLNLDESIDMNVKNESELSVMKYEIECLKEKLYEKDLEMQEQKLIADIEQLRFTKFCLDRFKHNEVH